MGILRRVLLLTALATFSLATLSAGVPDGGGRWANAKAPVEKLSLQQQVGQLILLRFVGTTPPEYVLDALRERRAAGVILFRDNVTGPGQLRALTGRLRRAGGAADRRRRPGRRRDPNPALGASLRLGA